MSSSDPFERFRSRELEGEEVGDRAERFRRGEPVRESEIRYLGELLPPSRLGPPGPLRRLQRRR